MATRLEPYQIFFTLYRDERRRLGEHERALRSTILNWAEDHLEARRPPLKESALNGFIEEIDRWNVDGTRPWGDLLDALQRVARDTA